MRDSLEKGNLALRPEEAKSNEHGIPGGAVDKNRPASAGDTGSFGKTPHAAGRLSPCTPSTEPMLQSPRAATTEPMCCNY